MQKRVIMSSIIFMMGSLILGGCAGNNEELAVPSIQKNNTVENSPADNNKIELKDVPNKNSSKKDQTKTSGDIINVDGLKSPGIADALLTKDAMIGVVMELAVKGCDKYDSHKSYMLKDPVMETEKKGHWQERWIVSACNNKYQIDLNFVEVIGEGTDWTIIK